MEYTPIHNRFWSDGWVRGLNALDRYLFLYLLTNGRGHPTGIYELPLDLMAAESGIDEKDLRNSMLSRLEPKIFYKEGWVIIKNWPNHRVSDSPKVLTGLRNSFNQLPQNIQKIAIQHGYPIDTLSIHIPVSPIRIDKIRTDENKKAILGKIAPSEITRVNTTTDGEEIPPKKKYARRGSPVWELREQLYKTLEADTGQAPTPNLGDYTRIDAALKAGLSEKDVVQMFEDALADRKIRTVREAFSDRQIDIYKQDNL